MKKTIGFLFLAASVFFTSCNSQKAKTFNDKVVKIQKDIVDQSKAIGSSTVENRIKLNDYIKTKLAELEKIEPVSGGETFKQAMVEDIKALSRVFEIAVKLADPGITPAEQVALTTERQLLITKIDKLDKQVLEEQKKFAKSKGIKLEYKN